MKAKTKEYINSYKIYPHNRTKEDQYLIAEKIVSTTSYGKEFVRYKVTESKGLKYCEYNPSELRKITPLNATQ